MSDVTQKLVMVPKVPGFIYKLVKDERKPMGFRASWRGQLVETETADEMFRMLLALGIVEIIEQPQPTIVVPDVVDP